MNNDKFMISKYIKEFIMSLDEYLLNYPKKYFELRNRLVNDSYELLELAYKANYTEKEYRKPIQTNAIMKINILDFYLEQSYKKKIISEKQALKLSNKLFSINKMLYKWINDEKCKN